jgi:sterol desaturase/sphingolipid hydroxylase (fatty acid hydroxylase superfamily)
MAVEQIYRYRHGVSQRGVLARDIFANIVQRFVLGTVVGMALLPVLLFVPEHFLGRKVYLASPEQLGPFWFQCVLILLSVSFFRYWMHRFQHSNEFLWKLHSYHHRVSDLTALNTDVSHPIDFALRNIVVFLVLGVVGFDPLAIVFAVPIGGVAAGTSHWGTDVRCGVLNYVFVTPEVHRWHHSAQVPEGHKYSCNYGVEFIFWDILFGTFHLPQENGEVVPPRRIGHPDGLPDEPNYLKLVLVPLGLYRPIGWFKRIRGASAT